jgi:RimJ/RimL family protein N-acetyltransferase
MIWWPTDVPTLSHGLITLRPSRESDIQSIYEACQDPLIPKFTTVPTNYTMAHAEFFIREKAPQSFLNQSELLLIIEKGVGADTRFVGPISFHSFDVANESAEIGYWISREMRGSGIGKIACQLLTDYGFTTMGYKRIQAHVNVENIASRKLLLASGYTLEGIIRSKVKEDNGQFTDMALFSVLRDEWKGL